MNAINTDEGFKNIMIVIILIFFIFLVIVVFMRIRKRNKGKKLQEEIKKLQQYVNSCDRKENQMELNTQQHILSQTNSFSKSHRIDGQGQGKIFMEFEKSEREIIVQSSSKNQIEDEEEKKQTEEKQNIQLSEIKKQQKIPFNKKKLNIEIPPD